MKKVYFLLFMMVVFLVTGCRGKAEEQTPTAVPASQPTVEIAATSAATETVVSPTTVSSSDPAHESIMATLSLLTKDEQPVQQFATTDYKIHELTLDQWLQELTATDQTWLALARVVVPPYHPNGVAGNQHFAPLWVLLGPEYLLTKTAAWHEMSSEKESGTATLYSSVSLPDSATLSELLTTRNEWYLSELQGVLWVDRLLLKIEDNAWQMNVFSTEATIVANIPYAFSCNITDQICIQLNKFETGESAKKIYSLITGQAQQELDQIHYLQLEDSRVLYCNPQTTVCFNELNPPVQCDSDNHVCYYQTKIGEPVQVLNLVNNVEEWSSEESQEMMPAGILPNDAAYFGYTSEYFVICNWERAECRNAKYDLPFDCWTEGWHGEINCEMAGLRSWDIPQGIVDAQKSFFQTHQLIECYGWASDTPECKFESGNILYSFSVSILHHSWFHVEPPGIFYCNIENRTCIVSNVYKANCDILTQSCTLHNAYTTETLRFDLISEPFVGRISSLGTFVPIHIHYDFYESVNPLLACDFKAMLCGLFDLSDLRLMDNLHLNPSGLAVEKRKCFRLNCPSGPRCTIVEYNRHQCYLYSTPRPQR